VRALSPNDSDGGVRGARLGAGYSIAGSLKARDSLRAQSFWLECGTNAHSETALPLDQTAARHKTNP
jgi:hypothetical protein